MIALDVQIEEYATELMLFTFEFEKELLYGLKATIAERDNANSPLYFALEHMESQNGWIGNYATYNEEDLQLIDAKLGGKDATVTYSIPIDLDDEAIIRDYGA